MKKTYDCKTKNGKCAIYMILRSLDRIQSLPDGCAVWDMAQDVSPSTATSKLIGDSVSYGRNVSKVNQNLRAKGE
jgi:hypothetical protein